MWWGRIEDTANPEPRLVRPPPLHHLSPPPSTWVHQHLDNLLFLLSQSPSPLQSLVSLCRFCRRDNHNLAHRRQETCAASWSVNGSRDGLARITHSYCHGVHAGVSYARLQSLRCQVLALLRLAHRRRDVSQLWNRRERQGIRAGDDRAGNPGGEDVRTTSARSSCSRLRVRMRMRAASLCLNEVADNSPPVGDARTAMTRTTPCTTWRGRRSMRTRWW